MPQKRRKHKNRIPKRRGKTRSKSSIAISEKQTMGFDYGIRPCIMSLPNPDFINFWGKAKSVAIAYTVIPQLDVRVNLPTAGMVFERYDYGEKLFKLMKSWMTSPNSESAVDIYFVEDTKQKIYYLVMGVNPEQLLLRSFGEDFEKDFLPLSFTSQICKRFPLSDNFRTFKEIAQNNEVLVCPVKATSKIDYRNDIGTSIVVPISEYQIGFSVGFIKRDIHFLEKDYLVSIQKYTISGRID